MGKVKFLTEFLVPRKMESAPIKPINDEESELSF